MWRQILAVVGLLVVFGCGGQTVEEPEGGGGQSGQGGTNGTGARASSSGGSAAGTSKAKLGDCVPGTPKAKASSCPWISDDGICYPTWDAACNCVCPLNVAEVYCMSDFPEDGIPTNVYCF
jgi:hypothetical protein